MGESLSKERMESSWRPAAFTPNYTRRNSNKPAGVRLGISRNEHDVFPDRASANSSRPEVPGCTSVQSQQFLIRSALAAIRAAILVERKDPNRPPDNT